MLRALDDSTDVLRLVIESLCKWMRTATKPALAPDFRLIYDHYLKLVLAAITLRMTYGPARAAAADADAGEAVQAVPAELVPVRPGSRTVHVRDHHVNQDYSTALSCSTSASQTSCTTGTHLLAHAQLHQTTGCVQLLWNNTVAALPADQGLDVQVATSYRFFADLAANSRPAIPPAVLEPLVRPGSQHQPPQTMTADSLTNYFRIIVLVNEAQGLIKGSRQDLIPDGPKYEVVSSSGEPLVGFDFLFEVLVKAYRQPVAVQAADMLVQVFVQPYSAYGRSFASWKPCALVTIVLPVCSLAHKFTQSTRWFRTSPGL